MNKIVELLIDWEDTDFGEELMVNVMSLVDKPAIGIDFLAFSDEVIVDNTGFEKFAEFFNENIDLFKKPGGGAAGDGSVNHAEQMKKLNAAGIDTEYPFGYCYQVAQFMFYAMGGYTGDYDLKCIKGMDYKVGDVDFSATHWYIQHKDTYNIVDLTASQFDDILDINDYYSQGTRANLGYPYYNVGDTRVEFDNTVPSFQSLKLYSKWREDHEAIEELEKYYIAAKYEELRKDFVEEEGPYQAEDEKAFLKLAAELGEEVDWQYATYIDGTQKEFADISDWVEGVRGLDILSRRGLTNEMEVKYRYAGPAAQRNFCKAMQRLNKLYTYEELQQMGRSVGNGIDSGANSIIKWKGGPNCRHYFEKVLVGREGRETVIISEGRATQNELGKAMEDRNNGGRRSVQQSAQFAFSSDDEMIVTGPAMTPRSLILRKDELGNPFHVYFSEDTIKKIAKKFFEYNKQNNTDINHDDNIVTNNTLLESWIVEDPNMDKSKAMGFDVPRGTWMCSYKINDEETWNKIKNGELNGYSISGQFIEKAAKL
jgi:hypothetical protein